MTKKVHGDARLFELERELEEFRELRRSGAQPSPHSPGVATCGVCGWRGMKPLVIFNGWDAGMRGRLVVCRWCRALGHTIGELEERARELARRTLERERAAKVSR